MLKAPCCTQDIFESFDELLLLKRGGQTIYAGVLHIWLLQMGSLQTLSPSYLLICFQGLPLFTENLPARCHRA